MAALPASPNTREKTNAGTPNTWKTRFAIVALLSLICLLLSRITIVNRNALHAFPALSYFLLASAIFFALYAASLVIRSIEIRTIKARLLASFIAIAVIPLVIVTIVATSSVIRATQESAIELLTVVVNLKASALNTWIGDIKQELALEKDNLSADYTLLDLVQATDGTSASHDKVLGRMIKATRSSENISEYLILDHNGSVLVSTQPAHTGMQVNLAGQPSDPDTSQPRLALTNIPGHAGKVLLIADPILDPSNQFAGYLAGIANPDRLTQIMREGDVLGETGEAYLVAPDLTLMTDSQHPGYSPGTAKILTRGAFDATLGKQNGNGTYQNYAGYEIIGAYRWLGDLDFAIFAEQSRSAAFTPVINTLLVISAVSILLISGAVLFGLSISNSIGKPLAELTTVSQRIASGELDLEVATLQRNDEISTLAEAFNRMTHQLRMLINDLERRVQERTAELERRNEQLIAASQLGNSITSFLDTNELIQQAVNLIQEKFHLYYVGLFLLDETHSQAILKAGTGHAGQSLLEHGHRIKVGEGMIGWCIEHARARIALQAGEDPMRLATPELPETRSEAAIPLRSRGLVIGALTIQSKHSNAFDDAMLTIFQTMADQIAVAIDNAVLIDQAQNAIEATRRAYGELSHRAWLEQISAKKIKAYCNENGVTITSQSGDDQHDSLACAHHNGNGEVTVPINIRGAVLGVLKAQKPPAAGQWTDDEKEILRTLSEQLGAALESARLFEETLTRAEKERVIGHIASRVRETLDIETVLKTATIEMQKALDLEEVQVEMNQENHRGGQG